MAEGDIYGSQPDARTAQPFEYKKGGKVKRGGLAKVHKGERVIPARPVRKSSRRS